MPHSIEALGLQTWPALSARGLEGFADSRAGRVEKRAPAPLGAVVPEVQPPTRGVMLKVRARSYNGTPVLVVVGPGLLA